MGQVGVSERNTDTTRPTALRADANSPLASLAVRDPQEDASQVLWSAASRLSMRTVTSTSGVIFSRRRPLPFPMVLALPFALPLFPVVGAGGAAGGAAGGGVRRLALTSTLLSTWMLLFEEPTTIPIASISFCSSSGPKVLLEYPTTTALAMMKLYTNDSLFIVTWYIVLGPWGAVTSMCTWCSQGVGRRQGGRGYSITPDWDSRSRLPSPPPPGGGGARKAAPGVPVGRDRVPPPSLPPPDALRAPRAHRGDSSPRAEHNVPGHDEQGVVCVQLHHREGGGRGVLQEHFRARGGAEAYRCYRDRGGLLEQQHPRT
mmetsp:Transcript_40129/g.128194  ORF Transcript_40129/g.128194 Transcript_40129/m.128194 type:complete len:316 (-) Transcript_40129:1228-2175(-)